MRDAWLAAILVLALAVRLANLWMTAALPVAHYQFTWEEADMATAWRWAERVAAGDVLARDTVHQYTSWMRDIAPPTTWERWWGGRGVFHQAPLYAYALALVRVLGGGGFWAVGLFQLALGLLDVVLVYAIAAHCFDRRAARLAALGAALYAPFLFYETLALRDTLATTTSLAALAAFLAAGISPLRWAGAGLLLAAAILARETTLLFAPVALALAAGRARAPCPSPRDWSRGSCRWWRATWPWGWPRSRSRPAASRASSTGTRPAAPPSGSSCRPPRATS